MEGSLRDGQPEEAGLPPDQIAHVRRLCAEWVDEGVTPALQVAVARRGVLVLHEAWGRLGPEPDAPPLTVESLYGIASITKPITAAAVMLLVDEGRIGLTRPVQEYIPEFTGEGKAAVLIHHLLTHTAGLRDDDLSAHVLAKRAAANQGNPDPLTYFRHLDDAHDAPLWKPPGAEMSYCVYGYWLLAEIVTRVAGRPIEQLVQQRLFDPLGMTSASYAGVPHERRQRMVRRAADAPMAVLNDPDTIGELGLGGGSAYMTALDLARFGHLFLNRGRCGARQVLSQASVGAMTRNQIPGISAHWAGEFYPEASWGYGWNVQSGKKPLRDAGLFSDATISHGGAGGTFLWVDPARALIGVYLSVGRSMISDRRVNWCADLFANAVTAAVVD
jgi:CubicO group peptidase (beta-lactamase class C family)